MTTIASVRLWGRLIGAVSLEAGQDYAAFQYTPEFARSQIEVSPLCMPLSDRVYSFPMLPLASFRGLPGLLADSLPDKYGNALIGAWLARQGRQPDSFNAVERLGYTGARGMGALEFEPSSGPVEQGSSAIELDALIDLASEVLRQRSGLSGSLARGHQEDALRDILRVGTSAGGARAKAVLAWNPKTGELRSGQITAGDGFEPWLIKFDGVRGNADKELDDPLGYGAIEFAYSEMAEAAGINMSECRLLEEHGRRHFMTRRFDRRPSGEKLHMQSLGAMAHYDFNSAGAYSYEQAFAVMRRLGLPMASVEQLFRRMAFNVVARNQDDHVKNIAFLMDKRGAWSLSPAFDVTYSYNPQGAWTSRHQMSLNGRLDGFARQDFRDCGRTASMKRGRADALLDDICVAVSRWPEFADAAAVPARVAEAIGRTHRMELFRLKP